MGIETNIAENVALLRESVDKLVEHSLRENGKLDQFSGITAKFDSLSKKFIKEIEFDNLKADLVGFVSENKQDEIQIKLTELEAKLEEYCSADLFDVFCIDFENFKSTFGAFKKGNILKEREIGEITSKLIKLVEEAETTVSTAKHSFHLISEQSFTLENKSELNINAVLSKFAFLEQSNKDKNIKIEELEKQLEQAKMPVKENKPPLNLENSCEMEVITRLNEQLLMKEQENSFIKEALEGLLDNYLEEFEVEDYFSAEKLQELVQSELKRNSEEKLRFGFKCLTDLGNKVNVDLTPIKEELDSRNYFDSFKRAVSLVEEGIKKEIESKENTLKIAFSKTKEEFEQIKQSLEIELEQNKSKFEEELQEIKKKGNTTPIKKVVLPRRNTEELAIKLKKVEAEYDKLKRRSVNHNRGELIKKIEELENDNSKLIQQKLEIAQEFDSVRDLASCFVENESKLIEKKIISNMLVNYFVNKKSKKSKSILETIAGVLNLSNEERILVGLKPLGQYLASEGSTRLNTSRLPSSRGLFG